MTALARSPLGTHDTTVSAAFGHPLRAVERVANRMVKDKTLVRVKTGVLFLSAHYGDWLMADRT